MFYLDPGKPFEWSEEKDAWLRSERAVGFADVVSAIGAGNLLDVCEHASGSQRRHQRLLVVLIHGYAYVVPYVESPECHFLKTVIPSRRAMRRYVGSGATDAQESPAGRGRT